jgi:hypothetical protein
VLDFLTEFELMVDSYGQPLQKSTDYEEEKKNYSASKKYTLKEPDNSHTIW